ncbi:hypothetical protein [Streptomyces canus]
MSARVPVRRRFLPAAQPGKCFDLPLVLERRDGRWTVRIRGGA